MLALEDRQRVGRSERETMMNKYLIKTNGTASFNTEGNRFYIQDGFFWFVDELGNCLFAKDAKEISSIEIVK